MHLALCLNTHYNERTKNKISKQFTYTKQNSITAKQHPDRYGNETRATKTDIIQLVSRLL